MTEENVLIMKTIQEIENVKDIAKRDQLRNELIAKMKVKIQEYKDFIDNLHDVEEKEYKDLLKEDDSYELFRNSDENNKYKGRIRFLSDASNTLESTADTLDSINF